MGEAWSCLKCEALYTVKKKKNPRRNKLLYAARAEGKDYPEAKHLMGARTELTLCNYCCWTLTDSSPAQLLHLSIGPLCDPKLGVIPQRGQQ